MSNILTTQEELVSQLKNARSIIDDLENSLRQFTYELTDNPYENSLEYLHIEFNNAYTAYLRSVAICKKDGLSVELIQYEARLDCLTQLLKDIPLIFIPENLKNLLGLEEEHEDD